MRRICLLHGVRLASKRLPAKLLMEVGGRRLIDSGLQFLKHAAQVTGATAIVAVCPIDAPLLDAVVENGISWMDQTPEGSRSEDFAGAFGCIRERLAERFDWVISCNFACHPFMSVRIAAAMVHRANTGENPFTVTRLRRGVIWDAAGKCIFGDGQTANGLLNPEYHEVTHHGTGMPSHLLSNEAEVARLMEPFAVDATWKDMVDIDTADDLAFANALAKGMDGAEEQ